MERGFTRSVNQRSIFTCKHFQNTAYSDRRNNKQFAF